MFNLDWFDTWIYHIVGWPILVLVLCAAVWMRVNWKTALIILPLSFIALGLLIVDIETFNFPDSSLIFNPSLIRLSKFSISIFIIYILEKSQSLTLVPFFSNIFCWH